MLVEFLEKMGDGLGWGCYGGKLVFGSTDDFLHSGIFELKVDGVVCYDFVKMLEEQLLVLCFKFLAQT